MLQEPGGVFREVGVSVMNLRVHGLERWILESSASGVASEGVRGDEISQELVMNGRPTVPQRTRASLQKTEG